MRGEASRSAILLCLCALLLAPATAAAQRPASRRPPPPPERLSLRGVGFAGMTFFTASETFDAVLGSSSGPIFGGGLHVKIPGGLFAQVVASRFSADGERAFVGPDGEAFPLGITTSVSITPLEISAGWRFRGLSRSVEPYVGGGLSSVAYEETADFAAAGDDVSERFTGFHLLGGAEVRVAKYVGIAGEVVWSSVADALGEGGVSQALRESNLGGTSLRLKIVVGR